MYWNNYGMQTPYSNPYGQTMQQLRDKVNALQMDNRMYGVVRYPNGYTYTAGPSPFCGCGGCA